MTMKKYEMLSHSMNVLTQLQHGKDPVSGACVPEGASILFQQDVQDAIRLAKNVLDSALRRGGYDAPQPFALTPEQRARLTPIQPWTGFVDLIQTLNQMVDPAKNQTLYTGSVLAWLEDQGLLAPVVPGEGCWDRTPEGEQLGICIREVDGLPAMCWLPQAQQFIFDHLEEVARWNWTHKEEEISLRDRFDPNIARLESVALEFLADGCEPSLGEALGDDMMAREEVRAAFAQAARVMDCSVKAGRYALPPLE